MILSFYSHVASVKAMEGLEFLPEKNQKEITVHLA
jgi:hypothetical protein